MATLPYPCYSSLRRLVKLTDHDFVRAVVTDFKQKNPQTAVMLLEWIRHWYLRTRSRTARQAIGEWCAVQRPRLVGELLEQHLGMVAVTL